MLGALALGKPLGITLFTWVGEKVFGLQRPSGMTYRHVFVVGVIAGIGFTVALFVSTAAFPVPPYNQETLDSVKMGALASIGVAGLAFLVARVLRVKCVKTQKTVR